MREYERLARENSPRDTAAAGQEDARVLRRLIQILNQIPNVFLSEGAVGIVGGTFFQYGAL